MQKRKRFNLRAALERLWLRREFGIAGIDDIGAILLSLLVVSGGTYVFGMALRNTVRSFTLHSQHQAIVDFRSQLRTDEDHAKWIGIPSTDIYGSSNSNNHEVDFYTTDSVGRPYFWAWYYNSTTQTVTRYTYSNPTTHSGLTADSQATPLSSATAFSATSTKISGVSNPFLSGQGVSDMTAENLGYSGMNASNNIITVTVSNANETVPIEIAPRVGPSGYTVIVGTYLKPGPLTINPSGSASITIATNSTTCYWSDGTLHSPCKVGLSEEYYTGAITITAYTCGSGFSLTPPSQNAQSTTPIYFNIGGPAAVTNCQFTMSDDHGGSQNFAVDVTGALNVSPTSIVGYVGKSYSVQASEANYYQAIAVNANNCSGIASISPSSQVANGSSAVTYTVTGAGKGSCTFYLYDNHGQSVAVSVTMNLPPGPLSVSPTSLTVQTGGATVTTTASDPNYASAFVIGSNTCGAYGATVATANGPSGTITVKSGASQGTCSFTVGDNYNTPIAVTVTLVPPAPTVYICSDQGYGTTLPYNSSDPNMSGGSGNTYKSSGARCSISVSSTSVTVTAGQTGASDSAQEWDDTTSLSFSGCGGTASVSPSSLGAQGSTSGYAGGSFTISGTAAGSCTLNVVDGGGKSVAISVTVKSAYTAQGPCDYDASPRTLCLLYWDETWGSQQFSCGGANGWGNWAACYVDGQADGLYYASNGVSVTASGNPQAMPAGTKAITAYANGTPSMNALLIYVQSGELSQVGASTASVQSASAYPTFSTTYCDVYNLSYTYWSYNASTQFQDSPQGSFDYWEYTYYSYPGSPSYSSVSGAGTYTLNSGYVNADC